MKEIWEQGEKLVGKGKKQFNKLRKSTFLQDFQAFVNRGNVVDMAVGVIIGGAFSKIVSSLVNDIVTPLLSLILGKANFSDLVVVLREAEVDAAGEVTAAAVTLNYGAFIQFIIDFLLVALIIFIVIRMMGKMRARFEKKEEPAAEEAAPAPEPEPTKEELLLTEIRDLLKK